MSGAATTWTPQNASIVEFDQSTARQICTNDSTSVALALSEDIELDRKYWVDGCDYFGVGKIPSERFRFESTHFGFTADAAMVNGSESNSSQGLPREDCVQ